MPVPRACCTLAPQIDSSLDLLNAAVAPELEGGVATVKEVAGYLGPAEEITLSNGVRVFLKATRFQDDEIRIQAIARGGQTEGLAVYGRAVVRYAQMIADEVGQYGAPPSAMLDLLSGKTVSGSTAIRQYDRVISGSCAPRDLAVALKLIHLLFVSPLTPNPARIKVRPAGASICRKNPWKWH